MNRAYVVDSEYGSLEAIFFHPTIKNMVELANHGNYVENFLEILPESILENLKEWETNEPIFDFFEHTVKTLTEIADKPDYYDFKKLGDDPWFSLWLSFMVSIENPSNLRKMYILIDSVT
jgi:hypothetical protein